MLNRSLLLHPSSQEIPPEEGQRRNLPPGPAGRVPTSRQRARGQRAPGGRHAQPREPRATRHTCHSSCRAPAQEGGERGQPREERRGSRETRADPAPPGTGAARPRRSRLPAGSPQRRVPPCCSGCGGRQGVPATPARPPALPPTPPPPRPARPCPPRPRHPLLTFSCARLSRFWTFLAKMPVLMSAMAAGPRRLRGAELAARRSGRRSGRRRRSGRGGAGEAAGSRRAPEGVREGRGGGDPLKATERRRDAPGRAVTRVAS